MDTELKAALDALQGETKNLVGGLKGQLDGLKTGLDAVQKQVDAIEVKAAKPGDSGVGPGGLAGYTTPGARFTKEADLDLFKKAGRIRFGAGHFWPDFSTKTLIDSTALGFSTPGILGADRITDGIVPVPRRRLVVRDLLRSRPITAGQIDWIQELAFTNSASPQTEGSPKQESADTFQIASEKVRTLAHWLPVTRQAADDLPELRRFIDENLLYGLKVVEEWELLFGDGSGEHLHGVCHQATAYAGTYAVLNDNKLDTLRHAILELEAADEECTGFIMNPKDIHDCDLIKTEDGGTANKGAYIIGDPLGGSLRVRTYWNRPVVSTNVMPAGSFLAGNFGNAVIGDRMGAVIDISSEHDDFFVRNKLALRCEERLSLAVLRVGSFRYGTF